jgi:hypothetical protein
MKRIQLIFASSAALFFVRPSGFSTANSATDRPPIDPGLQAQLDAQAAQIADLQKQLAASATAAPAPEDGGTLVLLCKGAGADLADVRWRVRAGLDPEQAVQAALAQAASDLRKTTTAQPAKPQNK